MILGFLGLAWLLGIAAAAFLAATLVWAQLLLPKMLIKGTE